MSAHQKVGTFQVAGGQKQGGNVASYFCTPDGRVLHAVAGPVDAATFLREVRWAVDTWELVLLEAAKDPLRQKALLRKAHGDRLRREHGGDIRRLRVPAGEPTRPLLNVLLDRHEQGQTQGRIHLMLAAYPLAKLDQLFAVVFEKVLGEKVSTQPVAKQ